MYLNASSTASAISHLERSMCALLSNAFVATFLPVFGSICSIAMNWSIGYKIRTFTFWLITAHVCYISRGNIRGYPDNTGPCNGHIVLISSAEAFFK